MRGAIFLSALLALSGCANNQAEQPVLASGNKLPTDSAVINLTKQLANELVRQNAQQIAKQPLLVATPVFLDSLSTTNELGLQIQQGLIAAMHDHQFNLLDVNVAERVKVTDQGDFLLSRDWKQLPAELSVSYVLVSTMSRSADALVVNSRIVNISDNRVASVASMSIDRTELPGYLYASDKVVSKQGLLYRYQDEGQDVIQLVGEMQ
ncbi:FlgO family outer membrane protein [Shewanella sp. Isolate11]|uniref:FlgO family outer membrane protein n=1 Tax=Shewanella sp. Isolate11 TaxID=2908530 RepID=UPI001EFE2736|nr:FlgO family outer membrane protein [Shewanella sp. Isolate11]MCG9697181.1 hypothetical protein [Shewanella sp. Isolate11]